MLDKIIIKILWLLYYFSIKRSVKSVKNEYNRDLHSTTIGPTDIPKYFKYLSPSPGEYNRYLKHPWGLKRFEIYSLLNRNTFFINISIRFMYAVFYNNDWVYNKMTDRSNSDNFITGFSESEFHELCDRMGISMEFVRTQMPYDIRSIEGIEWMLHAGHISPFVFKYDHKEQIMYLDTRNLFKKKYTKPDSAVLKMCISFDISSDRPRFKELIYNGRSYKNPNYRQICLINAAIHVYSSVILHFIGVHMIGTEQLVLRMDQMLPKNHKFRRAFGVYEHHVIEAAQRGHMTLQSKMMFGTYTCFSPKGLAKLTEKLTKPKKQRNLISDIFDKPFKFKGTSGVTMMNTAKLHQKSVKKFVKNINSHISIDRKLKKFINKLDHLVPDKRSSYRDKLEYIGYILAMGPIVHETLSNEYNLHKLHPDNGLNMNIRKSYVPKPLTPLKMEIYMLLLVYFTTAFNANSVNTIRYKYKHYESFKSEYDDLVHELSHNDPVNNQLSGDRIEVSNGW